MRKFPNGRVMKAVAFLRRVARKPPGHLMRRGLHEIRRYSRRRRLRREIAALTPQSLARRTGHENLSAFWRAAAAGFPYSLSEREELRNLYCGPYADACEALVARTKVILAHEFDLLGSGPTRLGKDIDWHRDFKSGRRWNLEPANKIDYAELDRPSDVKVAWELSRGHHLVTLGQAWLVDRDLVAVNEVTAQMLSWIRANPAGMGIHWACTMEVALRATNWIWTLGLLGDAPLGDEFVDAVLVALYRHGLWIPENLEWAHVNGNHYIANALGMVACGTLFRTLPEGRSWLERGAAILEEEIRLQVDEDGVDIEASIPYHRLVLEIFLTGALLLRFANLPPSQEYWKRLEAMTDFVHAYTQPDGLSPVVGDGDDGRVLVFGDAPVRDHRYLLSTGCVLFGRAEWKQRAHRLWEDTLWLLGPAGVARFGGLAKEIGTESRAFPASGYYILRSPRQYLFVDAGAVGFKGLGGHGHNDCLSFEWHVDGRPLLTDSGLFVYTASPEWRDRFRSTAFHNGIRVDGEEINRFLRPPTLWFLGNDAQPIEVSCKKTGCGEVLRAGHTGYRRLQDPVTVFRTFEMDPGHPVLRLVDRIEGAAGHQVEFFFHAAPGAAFLGGTGNKVHFRWPDGLVLQLECDSDLAVTFEGKEGWFAPSYGVKVSRPVCVATIFARLPFQLDWKLSVQEDRGMRTNGA
jgi:hypothetical protein